MSRPPPAPLRTEAARGPARPGAAEAGERTAGATGALPIDRSLAVLDAVVDHAEPLSLSDLARLLAVPVPTVHRLVAQLEARRLVRRALGSRRLLPGSRLLDLGMRIVAAGLRSDATHNVLEEIAEGSGGHCHIGIVKGHEVVYIDGAHAARPGTLRFEPGRTTPLHCTSIGKLYLASLGGAELDRELDRLVLERHTPNTITEAAELRRALAEVRRRAWATNDEEFVAGVVGCAVALRRGPSERFVAGLGIAVPTARLPFSELPRLVPLLQRGAARIAAILEASEPGPAAGRGNDA